VTCRLIAQNRIFSFAGRQDILEYTEYGTSVGSAWMKNGQVTSATRGRSNFHFRMVEVVMMWLMPLAGGLARGGSARTLQFRRLASFCRS